MQYDGFLSYATTSDYQNARKIESFLESFHKLASPAGAVIRRLQICRDGSDFALPKRERDSAATGDPIWQIILAQLQQAKYLLVLCSPAATKSPWVAREVAWFIENRGRKAIFPLVTEGVDPVHNPGECFPENVMAAGIHSERIWYDLRGYRGKAGSEKVRDHEDELVRLASDLLDWNSDGFGQLSTLWQREQLKMRRRQATLAIGVAVVLILLAGVASWKAIQSGREAVRARAAALVTTANSERDPTTSGLLLREVLSLSGDQAPYGANSLAVRVVGSARPLAVLRGHHGAVVSITFNHRGDKLLTASLDGTARIWPADLKGASTVFTGSGNSLVEATFSHDDKLILTAGMDGTARIWKVDGGVEPVILKGHQQALRTARFCADDSRVVTASDDTTVRIWSVADGSSLALFREHTGSVNSAVFNRKCDVVVTSSDDGTSRTWSPNGITHPAMFGFPNFMKASSAEWSPDESVILVATNEGTGWIWSPAKKFPFITLIGSSSPMSSASFSPDGEWIVSSQFDQLRLWQVSKLDWAGKTNKSDLSLDARSPVRRAVFSPDSTRVAAITQDGSTHVWTLNSNREPLTLGSHEGPVLDVAFSPDGNRIATVSADSTIRIWDTFAPKEPEEGDLHRGPAAGVQLASDATRVLTRTKDGTIWLWRLDATGFVQSAHSNKPFRTADLSSSERHIATINRDGKVQVVDAEMMQPLFQLPLEDPLVRVASVNGNGTTVVTIAGEKLVQLWRADALDAPVALDGHESDVHSARFSSDGLYVVTTSSDKTVRVWRTDSPHDSLIFHGHQATVRDAVFSRDGRYVVSASDDNTARVWDIQRKTEPRVLLGHPGPVFSAVFSEDGSKVITGSTGQARVWNLDRPDVPLDLKFRGVDFRAVAFSREGSEAIGATDDGRILTWHIDWRWLAANIARFPKACLSSDQRIRLLGESSHDASIEYNKCQLSIHQAR